MTDRLRTANDLLQTFRDATDPSYSDPLESESEGLGFDPTSGNARTFERSSYAIRRNTQGYYLLPHSEQSDDPASGAVRASTTITLMRTPPADAELRIPIRTPLAHSMLDSVGRPAVLQPFELGEEAVFEAGSLGPVEVLALATRPGNQGNLRALVLDGFADQGTVSVSCTVSAGNTLTDTGVPDVFFEALVGRYLRFISGVNAGQFRRVLSFSSGPLTASVVLEGAALTVGAAVVDALEWADLGVSLVQPDDITSGRHGSLDGVGLERGLGRTPGESDADYAYRLSELPDVVSPNAIDRICATALSPYGIRYSIHETRVNMHGFILDEAPLDEGEICGDITTEPWAGSVLFNAADATRFFAVCVSADDGLGSYGTPFDATNDGVNAYDSGGPGDGVPLTYNQVIAGLYRSIELARGGGVGWVLLQDRDL